MLQSETGCPGKTGGCEAAGCGDRGWKVRSMDRGRTGCEHRAAPRSLQRRGEQVDLLSATEIRDHRAGCTGSRGGGGNPLNLDLFEIMFPKMLSMRSEQKRCRW